MAACGAVSSSVKHQSKNPRGDYRGLLANLFAPEVPTNKDADGRKPTRRAIIQDAAFWPEAVDSDWH